MRQTFENIFGNSKRFLNNIQEHYVKTGLEINEKRPTHLGFINLADMLFSGKSQFLNLKLFVFEIA